MRWLWYVCLRNKKSSKEPSIGSGSSWSKRASKLEAQGRSLMVNHGIEPVKNWWKRGNFVALQVPEWMKELLQNSQLILLGLQQKIAALTIQLQRAAAPRQPRGLGLLTSVIIDR